MYSDCAMERTNTVSAPVDAPTLAKWADTTRDTLKEANMMLDRIMDNLFGPPMEKRCDTPEPPMYCLKDCLAFSVEQSKIILNRLLELNNRMFG